MPCKDDESSDNRKHGISATMPHISKTGKTHCHLTEKKRNTKIAIKKQLNHDICHKRKTESLVLVIEIKQTLQNRLFYYLNRKNQSSKQGQTIVPQLKTVWFPPVIPSSVIHNRTGFHIKRQVHFAPKTKFRIEEASTVLKAVRNAASITGDSMMKPPLPKL